MAAATVLGDGTVAMILDVTGIASHSRLSLPDDLDLTSDEGAGEGLHDETQTVLLLSNDPEERFGIPMELVDRVERIRSEQIDSVGGQRVLQYRGQSLPLLCLEDHIQAQPRPERSQVYVAVFRAADREVGLIIPNLIDIRQLSINVDTLTFREAGVIGSLVVDDHAVRLLDLYELCEAARPDWFVDRPQVQRDDDSRPTILLAEDSNFFRKQLVGYLESEGYDVVACEDGAVAWETLDIAEQPFDMLVTDLEMPNMDGFQLSRKVRDDGRFGAMPILAVTSLAGEEDMQRGREAGIDEYHVKLDRERLTVSIAARLRSVQAR